MVFRGVFMAFGIVFSFLFLSFTVDAQESSDEEEAIPVEPVVVTATRTEVSLSHVTASVTVITREEIEKRQFPYIREILRDVPGLIIVQSGSRGGTTPFPTTSRWS